MLANARCTKKRNLKSCFSNYIVDLSNSSWSPSFETLRDFKLIQNFVLLLKSNNFARKQMLLVLSDQILTIHM